MNVMGLYLIADDISRNQWTCAVTYFDGFARIRPVFRSVVMLWWWWWWWPFPRLWGFLGDCSTVHFPLALSF